MTKINPRSGAEHAVATGCSM